jgi:CheY-like chemotaxis protein
VITYQELFAGLPVPAFLLGPLAELVAVNEAAAAALGVSGGELDPGQPRFPFSGERWAGLLDDVAAALRGERTLLELPDPQEPAADRRLPVLCRALDDGQGGRLLLCVVALEASVMRSWFSLEEGHLHRVRLGRNPGRTLLSLLDLFRSALDVDRTVFLQLGRPMTDQAILVQESRRPGLPPLGELPSMPLSALGHLGRLAPGRTSAVVDLHAFSLSPVQRQLLAQVPVRALLAVEVRPAGCPRGLLLAFSLSPRRWQALEVQLWSSLGWMTGVLLDASARYGALEKRFQRDQLLLDGLAIHPGQGGHSLVELLRVLVLLTGARVVRLLGFRSVPACLLPAPEAGGWQLADEDVALAYLGEQGLEQESSTPWSMHLPTPLAARDGEGAPAELSWLLVVPVLTAGGDCLGLICLLLDAPPLQKGAELQRLGLLGRRLACLLIHGEPASDASCRQVPIPRPAPVEAGLELPLRERFVHDFNNILGSVTSYVGLASSRLEADHPALDDLRVVRDAVKQGSLLLQTLLPDEEPPSPPATSEPAAAGRAAPGVGAVLPRRASAVAVEPEEEALQTLLLIEDERLLRQSAERVLSGQGYRVLTAPDGQLALHLFQRFLGRIDLVVLDRGLPGLSGDATLRELRLLDPAVPVLLTSGACSAAQQRELLRAGATEFLPKPFSSAELLGAVRRILHGLSARPVAPRS